MKEYLQHALSLHKLCYIILYSLLHIIFMIVHVRELYTIWDTFAAEYMKMKWETCMGLWLELLSFNRKCKCVHTKITILVAQYYRSGFLTLYMWAEPV